MLEKHLTVGNLDRYVEQELDDRTRAEIAQHLAVCAACRTHIARDQRIDATLRTMPRGQPPRELAARISTAVELRVSQEQARRARMPFVAAATFFSMLLALWFSLETVIAFQENGVLDFFTLFTNYPDLFSTYALDAVLALLEALPISEIALTLFALLTVAVLMQQLVDTLRPRALQFK